MSPRRGRRADVDPPAGDGETTAARERFSPQLAPFVRSIDELHEDPENARDHGEENLAAIRASLRRFGQQKPIVIGADGTAIAGSGTLRAARAEGWRRLAAITTNLTGVEARAYGIADNRTGELAEWNTSMLRKLTESLEDEGIPFADVGFSDEDLAKLVNTVRSRPLPDVTEDFDVSPRPEPVWVLVETDAEAAARLERFFRDERLTGRLERSDQGGGDEVQRGARSSADRSAGRRHGD